jgi:hypothetical protein
MRLRGLSWLSLVLAFLATTVSATVSSDGTYDIIELSLSSALPGCAIVYQVLVAEVRFPNATAVRLQRSHTENAYKEGAASDILTVAGSQGTLDLRCNRGQTATCSWRSDAAPQSLPHLFPRSRMVPVEHAVSYAVTSFLGNLIFSKAHHSALITRGNKLRSLLVLKSTPTNACGVLFDDQGKQHGRDPMVSLRYEDPCFASLERHKGEEGSCSLHLLSEEEQLQRGRKEASLYYLQKKRAYQYFADSSSKNTDEVDNNGMQRLSGDFPLRRVRDAYTPSSTSAGSDNSGAEAIVVEKARTMEALRVGRSILRSAFPQLYGQPAAGYYPSNEESDAEGAYYEHQEGQGEDANGAEADNDPFTSPAFLELGAEARSAIEAAALSAAAATAEAGLPGLSGMLSPILDGLLKPVVGILAGVMSDLMGDSLQNVLGGTVQSGLTSEITALLTHALTNSLSEALVPPLTATLTDSITNTLTPQLRDAVSPPIAEQLTASVSASVSQSLSRSLSERLLETIPTGLSDLLTPELSYFLTQSVTQAVVPALTYTLHHSPAEDFYCAYCKEYKLYCEWCREGTSANYKPGAGNKDAKPAGGDNSPNDQLYRSHYHASYFSKYYAEQAMKQYKEGKGPQLDDDGLPAAPSPQPGGTAAKKT